MQINVQLREPHAKQQLIRQSKAKRKVIRAGRRGGKTTIAALISVEGFLAGRRVLYAVHTQEQVDKYWWEVKQALREGLERRIYYKNETRHIIEPIEGTTEQRIRAKTAWDADSLRGDFADLLILDEYQSMKPNAWGLVGAPMLLDNDGDAIFIYTAHPEARHARMLFKRARELQEEAEEKGEQPRWEVFSFSSHDNPHLSDIALREITEDMSGRAYKMEIMAEDEDDDPRALWNRELLEETRVYQHPELVRIVVGVDPPGSTTGECGIMVAGLAYKGDAPHGYILEDASIQGSPQTWAGQAVANYHKYDADRILAERNFGGDMVETTIRSVDPRVPVKMVTASRGKMTRAEPVVALYEQGRAHHVGEFPLLEDEQCSWYFSGSKSKPSPNRLDACVWVLTELLLEHSATELGTVEIGLY